MRTFVATLVMAVTCCLPVFSQDAGTGPSSSTSSTSSSSSSEYFRGYGVKDANVFAAKYKERLKNWREQIELGLSRGFLQPADADKYKAWLDQLTAQDAEFSAKGYPKPETDDMEQKFNAFNVDFTNAMQPKPAPASTTPAPKAAPPSTVPGKAPPAVKSSVKPPIPAAAKRKETLAAVKAKAKAAKRRR